MIFVVQQATMTHHSPRMPLHAQHRIRAWHEKTYASLSARTGATEISVAGLTLLVPPTVFPPTEPYLLATAVLNEVRAGDRVLDVGTGSGVNAIVAAARGATVLGVDISADAVACARENTERNGLTSAATFVVSDLFDGVSGLFDLIVFDPPFRWFRPRDQVEAAIADEDYGTLTRFMRAAPSFLETRGRILLHFGTSADIDYLHELIAESGLHSEVISEHELQQTDWSVRYFVFRLKNVKGSLSSSAS